MMDPRRWQRIKEIFGEAAELPSGDRGPHVDAACAHDEELRAEVLELLKHHEADVVSLPEIPVAVTSFVSGIGHEDMIGRQVGGYLIDREIGRGGMGNVYLAHRVDADFEQSVAVKLIKRGFDTDEIVSRFRHERRILAALDHPFITKLLDGGSTDDGRPYLVMEYVEGMPLSEYCDRNRLTVEQRLRLFLSVCSAVAYANVNLVIHRDLKPSNIVITPDGNPKLLDFGIAKLISPSTADGTAGTVNAFRAMTPDYASPEQIAGEKLTLASDVYSLGVILYELLSGSRPHRFKTASADQIMRTLNGVEPMRVSAAVTRPNIAESDEARERAAVRNAEVRGSEPGRLRRKLQGDLDKIVAMALRREPERRYPSARQLADDIERYLEGMPVEAREDSFGYRATKFVQRNKAGVVAGIGIGASLLFALASTSRQADRARRERDRAVREAQRAAAINRFAQRMLTSADPSRQGRDVKFVEVIEEAEAALDIDFRNQPETTAELRMSIGLVYLSLGSFDRAQEQLHKALEIRLTLFPRWSSPVADSLWAVAKLEHAKGHLKEAEVLYSEAIEILRDTRGENSVRLATVLTDFAYLLALIWRHEDSIAANQEAIRIKRLMLGADHPDVAISLAEIGNVLAMMMSKFEEAEPYQREALRIMRKRFKGDHPEVAKCLLYLGTSVHTRNLDEAVRHATEALEMRRRLLGDAHPDVAWALYNVGYYMIKAGRAEEARRNAEGVLAMVAKGLPEKHSVVNSTYLLLGRGLMMSGRYREALDAFDRCLALRRETLPPDHWLVYTTESFRGWALGMMGEVDEGVGLMRLAVDKLREKVGDEHGQTKEAEERLANFFSRNVI